jgi:hypothetical protein
VVEWFGEERLQVGVLGVGEFVATHGKPPFRVSPAPESGLPILGRVDKSP